MSAWLPHGSWPKPGDPGIYRCACSCRRWKAEGTEAEITAAALRHDDSPQRSHIVTIRARRIEEAPR